MVINISLNARLRANKKTFLFLYCLVYKYIHIHAEQTVQYIQEIKGDESL